jgi:hypothetical protein
MAGLGCGLPHPEPVEGQGLHAILPIFIRNFNLMLLTITASCSTVELQGNVINVLANYNSADWKNPLESRNSCLISYMSLINPMLVIPKVKAMEQTVIREQTTTTPLSGQSWEKKKAAFRASQIVWYIAGIINVIIGFRILLRALGANASGFTNLIYALSSPFVLPFQGIIASARSGSTVVEWSSMLAIIVYLVIAWGLAYLIDLMSPVTREEVTSQT